MIKQKIINLIKSSKISQLVILNKNKIKILAEKIIRKNLILSIYKLTNKNNIKLFDKSNTTNI